VRHGTHEHRTTEPARSSLRRRVKASVAATFTGLTFLYLHDAIAQNRSGIQPPKPVDVCVTAEPCLRYRYIVVFGREQSLCRQVRDAVNEQLSWADSGQFNAAPFGDHPLFVQWMRWDSLQPHGGIMGVSRVDIDNDGRTDTVYRWHKFQGGPRKDEIGVLKGVLDRLPHSMEELQQAVSYRIPSERSGGFVELPASSGKAGKLADHKGWTVPGSLNLLVAQGKTWILVSNEDARRLGGASLLFISPAGKPGRLLCTFREIRA
jgi:hypothetical protein